MMETNLPQSGDDNAQTASSGGGQPHEDGSRPVEDTTDEASGATSAEETESQYLPRFSRERLTRRQWQLAFSLMGSSLLIFAVVAAANIIRVPYVSLSPGSVYSLSEAVQVDGGEGEFAIYPPESDMGFVTVRKSHKLTLWRLFFDSLDTRTDINRHTDIYQGLSQEEIDRRRSMQMLGSQGDAVEIALRHLGLTRVILVPNFGADASINPLSCFYGERDESQAAESRDEFFGKLIPFEEDGAARINLIEGLRSLSDSDSKQMREDLEALWKPVAKLFIGDAIASVNGHPIQNTADLKAALEDVKPSEELNLEVEFVDRPAREVSAKLSETREDGWLILDLEEVALEPSESCPDSQSWIAINWPDLDLITKVSFDTGDVGGPSAGLAFALAVVDLLTEGDLTGGNRVATTGIFRTPFSDEVSSVGGVSQKTTAVRNSGYDVFLVPVNDYDEAISAAGDELRVEKVTTLRDALAVLECLGGDPVFPGTGAPEAAAETADLAACS